METTALPDPSEIEGNRESVWTTSFGLDPRPSLSRDVTADVCVVGAGIAGLTTAYMLAREGKAVVVVDSGPIGGGETGRTTAHLTNALDDRYYQIVEWRGEEEARLAAESHTAAISRIEAIAVRENIECDFERLDGYLFRSPSEPVDQLERELKACHAAGLLEVDIVERSPIESFDTGRCLRFPRQAQFHPLKYLAGLARAIESNGGLIFNFSPVVQIEGGLPARVATKDGPVLNARDVVVATNTPINNRIAVHTKLAAYRTYAMALTVPVGSVPKALYWDTEVPYHYIRLQEAGTELRSNEPNGTRALYDRLIVGGEDHKTGQGDDTIDRFARLEQWARERFPMIENVEFSWSGQVMESVDGLAFIGRNPMDHANVYIATGDSGMGMTHSTIAGMILSDLIMYRENPWTSLYDPARLPAKAASRFAQENLNVIAQYAERFTAGEVESVDEIQPGTGCVVKRGLSKIAAYRDEQGTLHEMSALCPHLRCVVGWNSAESTWDCPCHGSRFDRFGHVTNGPAVTDLQIIDDRRAEDRHIRKAGR